MKFIPSMPALIKGFLITVVSLVIIKYLPANVKAYIQG